MRSTPPRRVLGGAVESVLLTLAMAGDDGAYGELVRRRQSGLRNLLRRLARDRALADDLAQQSFIQAWRRLHTLRSPEAFGGWLRALAINVWRQHARTAFAERGGAAGAAGHAGAVAELEMPPLDPAAQLDLDRALAQLPGEVRLCVVLAYHEGMSHAEISLTTALPLGTVKSHIRRGAAALRARLIEYRPLPEDSHGR